MMNATDAAVANKAEMLVDKALKPSRKSKQSTRKRKERLVARAAEVGSAY